MKNEEISVGDRVQRKSGGPVMTVIEVVEPQATLEAIFNHGLHCQWREGKELKTDVFQPEDLKSADQEEN